MVEISIPYRDITHTFTNFKHVDWLVTNAYGGRPDTWGTNAAPTATSNLNQDANNNLVWIFDGVTNLWFRISNSYPLTVGKLYEIYYEIVEVVDASGSIKMEKMLYISGDGEEFGVHHTIMETTVGMKKVIVQAGDTDLILVRANDTFNLTFRLIAIKEYQGETEINMGGREKIVSA